MALRYVLKYELGLRYDNEEGCDWGAFHQHGEPTGWTPVKLNGSVNMGRICTGSMQDSMHRLSACSYVGMRAEAMHKPNVKLSDHSSITNRIIPTFSRSFHCYIISLCYTQHT